jgi:hypothetical protein
MQEEYTKIKLDIEKINFRIKEYL